MSTARERLQASREKLRAAMSPPVVAASKRKFRADSWLRRLAALPTFNAVGDSVSSWWANHPLRPITQIATEASGAVVKPLAQRNPWMLVLVAAAIGAGVAWTRPWRWALRSALFAGLVPQLTSRVVSSLPIESWMSMVASALTPTRTRSAAASEAGVDAPAL